MGLGIGPFCQTTNMLDGVVFRRKVTSGTLVLSYGPTPLVLEQAFQERRSSLPLLMNAFPL